MYPNTGYQKLVYKIYCEMKTCICKIIYFTFIFFYYIWPFGLGLNKDFISYCTHGTTYMVQVILID